MQARLLVKNFGPIEDVDLDLRNVNVFIGPQASGKSALAKIYTICKSPLSFYNDGTNKNSLGLNGRQSNEDRFRKILEDYNVGSFLNEDTYISFSSELHDFSYSKDGIVYDRKIFKKIEELERLGEDLEGNRSRINRILSELHEKLFSFRLSVRKFFKTKNVFSQQDFENHLSNNAINLKQLTRLINSLKFIENDLSSILALYIPAERNFIVIIKDAALNLLNNNVPIPKHILSFGAEFEKAISKKKELDLSFLKQGLLFKNENGLDKIYYSKNRSIKLTEAASGLQSIVPLLLTISSISDDDNFLKHNSFVIEEPELNLFPKAQYELIKILEALRIDPFSNTQDVGTIHTYTTHSPYILSAFNNLLFAGKIVDRIDEKHESEGKPYDEYELAVDPIYEVLPTHIYSNSFSAYQICDGTAQSIFNREKGLIEDNYIDEVTDKMGDDFDALMELMEEQ